MGEPRALRRARPDDYEAVRLLQQIAVIANEAETFNAAVRATLERVCSYTGWPVGHAFLTSPEGDVRSSDLWHLDDPKRYASFRRVTDDTQLEKGIGLPGRVVATGKPAWIRDVLVDTNFPRARRGVDIAVRAGFAVPVLIGRHVAAVLEFFADVPLSRDDKLLELIGYVGNQVGRVAEREMAASTLLMQVEQQQKLIDQAYDPFVSIDDHGRIIGWNKAAEDTFGWPSADVMGLPLAATIIPKRHRDHHLSGVARYLATGRSSILNQRVELVALHRDGHEFPVEVAVWPVKHDGVTTFCAFVHDITERKRAERELRVEGEIVRDNQRRLEDAQEMAGVGSWEWDIERDIVTWSGQLYRNFGVDPEAFEPSFQAYMDLVHPEDRASVAATITGALDSLGTFAFDHRVVLPHTSEVRTHHCTGRVIVSDGRAMKMAGTNQDVTKARLEAEQLLAVVSDLIVASPNQPSVVAEPDGETGSAA